MVAAYENTIICSDCNNADTMAKKAANTHSDFSFSPKELRLIVKPTANKNHKIAPEIAIQTWDAQRKTFELRMKIIDRIAEIAANNEHWFQHGSLDNDPKAIYLRAELMIKQPYPLEIVAAENIWRILAGTKPKVSTRSISRWREETHKSPKDTPPPGEVKHAGQVELPTFWENTTDHWTCPGCSRTQIVRKNKDGNWSMPTSQRYFYSNTGHRKKEEIRTCGNCAVVAESIGKEAASQVPPKPNQSYTAMVSLDDVARCIIPLAHTRHNINNTIAEEIIQIICKRLSL